MATMQTFSAFAPKPDIAGVAQRRQALQQQANESVLRFQAQQQQLRQSREIAEMEAMAKERQFQQSALMDMQRLSVEREYKNQSLGLQERKLQQEASKMAQQLQLREGLVRTIDEIDQNPNLTPEQRHQAKSAATFRAGAMGVTLPGMGGMISATRPSKTIQTEPDYITQPDGTVRPVNRNTGQPWPEQRKEKVEEDTVLQRQLLTGQISSAERELAEVRKAVSEAEGNFLYEKYSKLPEEKRNDMGRSIIRKVETGRARMKELEATLNQLRSGGGQPAPSTGPKRLRFNINTGQFE